MFRPNAVAKLTAALLLATLAAGCGSKGPLTLPEEPPPKQQPSPTNTAPPR